MKQKVIVITPPLVQLNSPYPSGAYLTAFFKQQGCDCTWYDLSIQLFHSIFSKDGLTKLFALSSKNALKMADRALQEGDESTAFNLRRYVSSSDQWISWIDFITGILCCGKNNFSGREKEHQFLYSPFAPRGSRMEGFLGNLNREPAVDDVRFLCTLALADLADYITAVFDREFSLIRYAEALTVNESSFAEIEKNIESPVMKEFYLPVLEKNFKSLTKVDMNSGDRPEKFLVCISIPFAGTFCPALFTASYLKKLLGARCYITIGGGFVNTELREAEDMALSKYIDAISYDRGYGSYKELLESSILSREAVSAPEKNPAGSSASGIKPFYKLRQFTPSGVITPSAAPAPATIAFEEKATASTIPDYTDIDFSIYPRVCDDKNAMHRLWTDGAWIKAYLAHGCYWHKCAFCDTQLDYVCGYKPVEINSLYNGLLQTAQSKGIYGLHFVDEALPPSALKQFALLNAQNHNPLYYWGNVRFEKAFTRDLADFLSFCGFGGVSAGLEVATAKGLKAINKGTDIDSVVSACAAFKEAGILVHAYMIYGFWMDTPQSIIDSMETLRQFFKAGLLDSAFWHKFVLTKNSTVFAEWKKGLHPDLKPVLNNEKSMFAKNDLHFEGEEKYNRYGSALDAALDAWMHNRDLDKNVRKWFDFEVPSPSIPKNYIEQAIERYEENKEKQWAKPLSGNIEGLYFLGTKPYAIKGGQNGQKGQKGSSWKLQWFYLQEAFESEPLMLKKDCMAQELCELLWKLTPCCKAEEREAVLEEIKKSPELQELLLQFRGLGLVLV